MRSIRSYRHGKAQETVAAKFKGNGRQHHGTTRWRLHVSIRQPGMHRPHRHLDGKRHEESQEDQDLRLEAERQLVVIHQLKTIALVIEIDESHQHQQIKV